jgi:hypothetical protein
MDLCTGVVIGVAFVTSLISPLKLQTCLNISDRDLLNIPSPHSYSRQTCATPSRRTSSRTAAMSESRQTNSQKRKLSETASDSGESSPHAANLDVDKYTPGNEKRAPSPKKQKLVKKLSLSDLPNELLQAVFMECQPKALGKLMQVCKRFQWLLESDSTVGS